jgi:hypothetical protein
MKSLLHFTSVLAVAGAMALPLAAHAGQLVWSGNVDDRATVTIHGRDVRTNTVSGKSVSNASSQIFGRLPTEHPVFLTLDKRGRGMVRLVQQPRPFNNFTAVVRIHDPQPGAGHYRFTLNW